MLTAEQRNQRIQAGAFIQASSKCADFGCGPKQQQKRRSSDGEQQTNLAFQHPQIGRRRDGDERRPLATASARSAIIGRNDPSEENNVDHGWTCQCRGKPFTPISIRHSHLAAGDQGDLEGLRRVLGAA
jgi:hypothetical protein